MVEVSVIIPVYNGERWLHRTLMSLKNQNFEDFEVLCIDDCSTDSSRDIVGQFATEDDRFKLLRCQSNLGIVPKVINFAAPSVRGKSFVYSSQDDLFSTDWLAKMVSTARSTNADAVVPDVEFFFEGGTQNKRLVGLHGDRSVILTGREAFLHSLDWQISGNALWPARFLQAPGFSDFGTFADEYSVRNFYLHCESVAFCDGVFFYRQDNSEAITKKVSSKLLDMPDNYYRLWCLCRDNGFSDDVLAVRAYYTLRSLIKAKALTYGHPELRAFGKVVDRCYADIQSEAFSTDLARYLNHNSGPAKRALYTAAQRSRWWLDSAARFTSILQNAKQKRRPGAS